MKDASSLIPAYLWRLLTQIALPKWVLAFAAGALEYIMPQIAPGVAFATGGLIVLDTMTGILRAKLTGVRVTSAKLGRFLTKCFAYAAALITVAFAMHIVPDTASLQTPAITALVTAVAMTEAYSIFENLRAIGYPLPRPIQNLIQALLESAKPREK